MKIIITEIGSKDIVYESTEFNENELEGQKELAFTSLDTKYNNFNPFQKTMGLVMEIREVKEQRVFVTKI